MKTTTIKCDDCGADLTEGGAMPSFYLTLSCGSRPNNTGFSYAVMVHPPIKNEMHFCGLSCLSHKLSPDIED